MDRSESKSLLADSRRAVCRFIRPGRTTHVADLLSTSTCWPSVAPQLLEGLVKVDDDDDDDDNDDDDGDGGGMVVMVMMMMMMMMMMMGVVVVVVWWW